MCMYNLYVYVYVYIYILCACMYIYIYIPCIQVHLQKQYTWYNQPLRAATLTAALAAATLTSSCLCRSKKLQAWPCDVAQAFLLQQRKRMVTGTCHMYGVLFTVYFHAICWKRHGYNQLHSYVHNTTNNSQQQQHTY